MVKKIVWAVLLALLPLSSLFAQTYPKGAILDSAPYDSLPRKATQLSREYTALPRAFSLKQYAPTPGNQGQYGTCVAWASAYAARTISESVALGRRNQDAVKMPAFERSMDFLNILL